MQYLHALKLTPQNNRDRKAERLADAWIDGRPVVIPPPAPTMTKRELDQITKPTPKLNDDEDVTALLEAIQVMREEKATKIDTAVADRIKHCVTQVMHSLKLNAHTRLLRNRNELNTLITTYGYKAFSEVCESMGVDATEAIGQSNVSH